MFLRVISLLLMFSLLTRALAQEDVDQWLQRMGCDALLASYLEDILEHGDRNTKIRAAKQLAHVYAIMLARADEEGDREILLRAISLFDRSPEAATDELRLQIYRATYVASEMILERYRLRISSRDEADIAIAQLREVCSELSKFRDTLKRKMRLKRTPIEKDKEQLGLVTSYLAWANYYIAWYETDISRAKQSSQLFAELLLGDKPDLSSVSLDLKVYEAGARAILGIALCKSIMHGPGSSGPWFDELEKPGTWGSVRSQLPLWKYFLFIDNKEWNNVLLMLDSSQRVNQLLMCRVAASHSHENLTDPAAKKVAEKSLSILVEIGQLGVVSDIIKQYGNEVLPRDGFISNYIEGDIAFRQAKEKYSIEEPANDENATRLFAEIANVFRKATESSDAKSFSSLVDDCQFMLGLSLFYSSQFEKAAVAFQLAAKGDNKEQAIWMAIVNYDYVESLTVEQQASKEELVELYISNWPNSEHAVALTFHQSKLDAPTFQTVDDLLAIPHSDSNYEEAQRKASRSLYYLWQSASDVQRVTIGNKYISVALPLMVADLVLSDDLHATEVCAVRALRILEASLHPDIDRIVAARRSIEAIEEIQERQTFSLDTFQNEISFRKVALSLLQDEIVTASELLLEMIRVSDKGLWTMRASNLLWNHWYSKKIDAAPEMRYAVGKQLLSQIQEHEYGEREYLDIAIQTASSAFELYVQEGDATAAADALKISRYIVSQASDIVQVLLLSAEIESELGDTGLAKERWQVVVSGSKPGSLQWIKARCNTILILADESPTRALKVLQQHQVLYPNYGLEPYGSILRRLHEKIQRGEHGS